MSTNEIKNKSMKKILNPIKSSLIKQDSTVSEYFSPRRLRSHIKIKYEEDKPIVKKPNLEKIKEVKVPKRKLYNPESLIQVKVKKEKLKNIFEEPENWKIILENLKLMRSENSAPVDTMGCDKCADENLDGKTKRFQILVALMLSSQSKDQLTYEIMNRLKEKNLIPENIMKMKVDDLEKSLYPISFYKNKAKNLQKTANILISEYDSDIPNTITDLLKLPGVGPKMAHICMKSAWNIVTGIGVDIHVHRISNRLKWANSNKPEKTRDQLESWLPSEYWGEVNNLLVGFGQTVCIAVNPKCTDCKNQNICPSAFKHLDKKKNSN